MASDLVIITLGRFWGEELRVTSLLIVEDEKPAADALLALVRRYEESRGVSFDVEVVGAAFELLDAVRTYDICLLDIQLPGINGMEAAELLRSQHRVTSIIFVTDLAQYAMRGYEVDALGFLVKPATFAGLAMYLDRALREVVRGANRTLTVPTGDGFRSVPLSQVTYIEVRNHGLIYHTVGGDDLRTRGSLAQVERELADAPMVRVSRYCLANMALITSVLGDEVTVAGGAALHITRGHKKEIELALARYLGGRR